MRSQISRVRNEAKIAGFTIKPNCRVYSEANIQVLGQSKNPRFCLSLSLRMRDREYFEGPRAVKMDVFFFFLLCVILSGPRQESELQW